MRQRGHYGKRTEHARIRVGIGDADFTRIAVRVAGSEEQAGERRRRRTVAEAVHHARSEILRYNISMLDEFAGKLDRFRLGEIERDTALALVILIEVACAIDSRLLVRKWPDQSRRANPLGGFDADHLSSKMGKLQRAVRSRPYPCEIK